MDGNLMAEFQAVFPYNFVADPSDRPLTVGAGETQMATITHGQRAALSGMQERSIGQFIAVPVLNPPMVLISISAFCLVQHKYRYLPTLIRSEKPTHFQVGVIGQQVGVRH
jgi:hypothetical protein